MGYLVPGEYAAFGLGAETAEAWVTASSAMMDAFCRRPTLMSASYTERLRVPRASQTVRLSYGPLVSVDAVRARYARVRPDELLPMQQEFVQVFGLQEAWVDVDVASLDVSLATGEFAFGWGGSGCLMGLRYGEAEVTYTAGLAVVPDVLKVACAQIVRNAQATPGLNVKSSKMDTLQTQYFSDSLLDAQVKAMLRPYVAERLG